MNCPEESVWLRYLDRELDAGESDRLSDHLERCAACADRVFELVELTQFTQSALKAGDVPVPEPVSGPRPRTVWRRWGGVAAAAAVALAAVGSIGPHQVLAALANTFQMNQLQTVSLSQQQIFNMMNKLNQNGKVDLKQFGSVQVHQAASTHQAPMGLSQAYRSSGLPAVLPPSAAPAGTQANLTPATTLVFTPKVDAINRLIRMEGGTQFFPASLNNQPVTLKVSQSLTAYSQSSQVNMTEMRMPTLTVPPGVSVKKVAVAFASLPFLPANVRQSLLAIHDWKTTLVMPVQGTTQSVTVQGHPATFDVSKQGQQLVWVQNGVLVVFSHYGGSETASQFLAQVRQWLQ